jgi:hypothetical protein
MKHPFLVLSLPRSRSYWMSQWLAVPHDLGTTVSSVHQFACSVVAAGGSVETGAAEFYKTIQRVLPKARLLVLWRDPEDVIDSLERLGAPWAREEIELRASALQELATLGVPSIHSDELSNPLRAAEVWEYLKEIPFDFELWRSLVNVKLEINWAKRLERLEERNFEISLLRSEAAAGADFVWCGREPWESMADEAIALGKAHFLESNAGIPEWYSYEVDKAALDAANSCGALVIWTVRINCELVGYLIWQLGFDTEAKGQLMATQGVWFVEPSAPQGLGIRMMNESLEYLWTCGAKVVHFHHPMSGRGAKLGKLFQRLGASQTQVRYSLWRKTDA